MKASNTYASLGTGANTHIENTKGAIMAISEFKTEIVKLVQLLRIPGQFKSPLAIFPGISLLHLLCILRL